MPPIPKKVLVCQNVTCQQQGASQVLAAFEQLAERHKCPLATSDVPGTHPSTAGKTRALGGTASRERPLSEPLSPTSPLSSAPLSTTPLSTDPLSTDPFVPVASGCLGQCGNGPMVLVLDLTQTQRSKPKTWYHRVRPKDVPLIVKQHLLGDRLVTHKLYPAIHGTQKPIWLWVVGLALFLLGCVLLAWSIGSRYAPMY